MEKPRFAVQLWLKGELRNVVRFSRRESAELYMEQRRHTPYDMRLVEIEDEI